ncbi:MAG: hypothetical protein ACTSXQ_01975 [Alphaproteobacteria bacterium]
MAEKKNDILARIEAIEVRNESVALNKAWETSLTRILSITFMTYLVVAIFLFFLGVTRPFMAAVVPAVGFYFSTRGLPIFRMIWEKVRK